MLRCLENHRICYRIRFQKLFKRVLGTTLEWGELPSTAPPVFLGAYGL